MKVVRAAKTKAARFKCEARRTSKVDPSGEGFWLLDEPHDLGGSYSNVSRTHTLEAIEEWMQRMHVGDTLTLTIKKVKEG